MKSRAAWPCGVALCSLLAAGAAAQTTVLGEVTPLPGTVAEVVSPAPGRIISPRETPYTLGDRVKAGDPLAIIEHRYNLHDSAHLSTIRWDLLKMVLETRTAALEARIARERAERLMQLGSASGQQVQDLRAAELAAKAEYEKQRTLLAQQDSEMQQANLVRKGIFSPIDGDISYAHYTQSQFIVDGVLLFRIVNLEAVGVAARFPEKERPRLRSSAKARIRFDSLPGKDYVGALEVIPPLVDPQSRTWNVVFRVENPGEHLRFGMIGQVELLP